MIGVPSVREIFSYWPALIEKNVVKPRIALVEETVVSEAYAPRLVSWGRRETVVSTLSSG